MRTDAERRDEIGIIFENTRKKSNVSQNKIASELNITRQTWNNWINGISMPYLDDGIKIFRVLNAPIGHALSPYIYTESSYDPKLTDKVRIKFEICHIIRNNLTDLEILQVDRFLTGNYTDRYAFIQLSMAHLLSLLGSRYKVADDIYRAYTDQKILNSLLYPDDPQPDIEVLSIAINQGLNAHLGDSLAYSFETRTSNICEMIINLRESHGLSAKDFASLNGITKSTLSNWESGKYQLGFDEVIKMLEVVREPIGRFLSSYMYPNSIFHGDRNIIEEAKERICTVINKAMTYLELRQIRFFLSSIYGSRYAFIQLSCAHLHTDMRARYENATKVIRNYKEVLMRNAIPYEDAALPDIDYLERARDAGRQAHFNNERIYRLV